MISKIQISNIATYKSASLNPRAINFIYGGNGTGKTTLSRFLSNGCFDSQSYIEWDDANHSKVIAYNRDFREKNFSSEKDLPGIFTLGSESIETQKEINALVEQEKKISEGIDIRNTALKNIDKDITELKADTRDKCWELEEKYGSEFAAALTGYRGSKDTFLKKCLDEYGDGKEIPVSLPLEEIRELYAAAFSKETKKENLYSEIDISEMEQLEKTDLLSKVISGSADSPIGTFIEYLQAEDWVKQGVAFSKQAGGKCPFCQREMPDDLVKQISDFFDERYEAEYSALNEFQIKYKSAYNSIMESLEEILQNKCSFLAYDELTAIRTNFQLLCEQNITLIQNKIDTPSKPIEIKSVIDTLKIINDAIALFNQRIEKNNEVVEKQKEYKQKCSDSLWVYFINELKNDLSDYKKKEAGKSKGKTSVENERNKLAEQRSQIKAAIESKENLLTGVAPTAKAINKILSGFGFTGFSLSENPQKKGTYIIVRNDGSSAGETLSEGEYNFISFLYFYHLCFGSQTKTGVTDSKILVIDDPISSLDSNVIFVVSTLVKDIINNCRNKANGIEQVFILTHNVYFHKEVTFLGSREHYSPYEVSYYVIRKNEDISSIVHFNDNPIKSSYEILWDDLRNTNENSAKNVLNTMRRILEHYFSVIGGINYETCISKFEGEDKIICKALVAFINDGSHSVFDDLIVSFDTTTIENYKRVFKLIFENLNHSEHYHMMMKDSETT